MTDPEINHEYFRIDGRLNVALFVYDGDEEFSWALRCTCLPQEVDEMIKQMSNRLMLTYKEWLRERTQGNAI